MRRIAAIVVCALLITPFVLDAAQQTRRGRQRVPDYSRMVDDIHSLTERYADIVRFKPDHKDGTLEKLQQKMAALPAEKRDSVMNANYAAIVKLFEQERTRRALAFTDCYYKLAKPSDPNLGALYLNDIAVAIENMDSVRLRQRIDSLRTYADSNDLDYDQDLADAEVNMTAIRKRIKFKEMTMTEMFKDHPYVWVLDPDCRKSARSTWWVYPSLIEVSGSEPPRLLSMNQLQKSKWSYIIPGATSKITFNYVYKNKDLWLNEPDKSLFNAWGTERGGNSNPELIASMRNTVKNTHASISGELARKKYSTSQRIGGEVAVTLTDALVNSFLDALSVTTQTAERNELSLTLTSPAVLEGELSSVVVETRSDRPYAPTTRNYRARVRFIRTYPEEGLYMLNYKLEPMWQYYIGSDKVRARIDAEQAKHKLKEKAWKATQKKWKKENKGMKPRFNKYYEYHNDSVMAILKERATNGFDSINL